MNIFKCYTICNMAIYTGSHRKRIQKRNVISHYWILPTHLYAQQELWRCGTQDKKMILLLIWNLYKEKTRETVGLWHSVNYWRTLHLRYQMVKSIVLSEIPSSLITHCFVDYSDSLLRQIEVVVNVSLWGLGLNLRFVISWLSEVGNLPSFSIP